MEYLKLLEHSYKVCCDDEEEITRLEFLALHVFNFTTYDGCIDELFAKKALEVCSAINNRETFKYHNDNENYVWYLLLCNMPFFIDKLEWGTSIRGAWWDHKEFKISSCGFWEKDEQIDELRFNTTQWYSFIKAMEGFIAIDKEYNPPMHLPATLPIKLAVSLASDFYVI